MAAHRLRVAYRNLYEDLVVAAHTPRGTKALRRRIVNVLVAKNPYAAPFAKVGAVLEKLSRAGLLDRAVVLGSLSYQTYGSSLGFRIPEFAVRPTAGEVSAPDLSIAVKEGPSILGALERADPTFVWMRNRKTPFLNRYRSEDGFTVEVLSVVQSEDYIEEGLSKLGSAVDLLRYLITEPEPAVVLHKAGVPIQVPSPARYAVYQLLTARLRRFGGIAKLAHEQTESLLPSLGSLRTIEIFDVWNAAWEQGFMWQQRLIKALAQFEPVVRDHFLQLVCRNRAIIPGLTVLPLDESFSYKFQNEAIVFFIQTECKGKKQRIKCHVTADALADFGSKSAEEAYCKMAFQRHKAKIMDLVRYKYLIGQIEEPNTVIVRAGDQEKWL